tara:strand:- start:1183 stop:1548 length:366 start_codon:yes stop_codon:yes gene_type:complete
MFPYLNLKKTMSILHKISWNMRKFHLNIQFIGIHLNGPNEEWGIEILKITNGFNSYSLFKFLFYLPNYTHRYKFNWDGDLFFLRNNFVKQLDELQDHQLWSPKTFTKLPKLKYNILKFILE